MKISYFEDTDTLYFEFGYSIDTETRDPDENTILDMDSLGNIVSITMEHASTRTDVHNLTVSGIHA